MCKARQSLRSPIDTCLFLNSLNSLETSSEMLALQPRNQVTWFRDGHPPHPPRPDLVGAGSAAPAEDTEASPQCRLTKRGQLALSGEQEESMRIVLSFLLAAALACAVTPTLCRTSSGYAGHAGSSHTLERHQHCRR